MELPAQVRDPVEVRLIAVDELVIPPSRLIVSAAGSDDVTKITFSDARPDPEMRGLLDSLRPVTRTVEVLEVAPAISLVESAERDLQAGEGGQSELDRLRALLEAPLSVPGVSLVTVVGQVEWIDLTADSQAAPDEGEAG